MLTKQKNGMESQFHSHLHSILISIPFPLHSIPFHHTKKPLKKCLYHHFSQAKVQLPHLFNLGILVPKIINLSQNLIFPINFKVGLEYHKLCTLFDIFQTDPNKIFSLKSYFTWQPWYVSLYFKLLFKSITSRIKKSRRKPHWFNCVKYDKKISRKLVKYGDRHVVWNTKQSA